MALYIMVGCPGAGKSTAIRTVLLPNRKNIIHISRDDIRFGLLKPDEDYFAHEEEVRNIFISQIVENLDNGVDVIADATHLTRARRKSLVQEINRRVAYPYDIYFVYVPASLDTCLARNRQRTGRALVPEEALIQMHHILQPPILAELSNVRGVITLTTSLKEVK